jgi:hypothetical protein
MHYIANLSIGTNVDILQEKVHAEAAKMIPDTKARLTKAAEELRELMASPRLLLKVLSLLDN